MPSDLHSGGRALCLVCARECLNPRPPCRTQACRRACVHRQQTAGRQAATSHLHALVALLRRRRRARPLHRGGCHGLRGRQSGIVSDGVRGKAWRGLRVAHSHAPGHACRCRRPQRRAVRLRALPTHPSLPRVRQRAGSVCKQWRRGLPAWLRLGVFLRADGNEGGT